jgi:hypothetical protein
MFYRHANIQTAVSLLLEIIFFCFAIQVKLAINRTTAHNCQLQLSLSIENKIKIILSIANKQTLRKPKRYWVQWTRSYKEVRKGRPVYREVLLYTSYR